MKIVWVLVVVYTYGGPNPVVVDNIATKYECQKLQKLLPESNPKIRSSTCVEIKKK